MSDEEESYTHRPPPAMTSFEAFPIPANLPSAYNASVREKQQNSSNNNNGSGKGMPSGSANSATDAAGGAALSPTTGAHHRRSSLMTGVSNGSFGGGGGGAAFGPSSPMKRRQSVGTALGPSSPYSGASPTHRRSSVSGPLLRVQTGLGGGGGGFGGLLVSSSDAASYGGVGDNSTLLASPSFGGGGGGLESSRRSGNQPPLHRRSTMRMGGGGGASHDDEDDAAERRKQEALQGGGGGPQLTYGEVSAAAFEQYNNAQLQLNVGNLNALDGAGIGGTSLSLGADPLSRSVLAAGVSPHLVSPNLAASSVPASVRKARFAEEAAKHLADGEVHSEGGSDDDGEKSSEEDEPLDFFVQQASSDDDDDDDDVAGGVRRNEFTEGHNFYDGREEGEEGYEDDDYDEDDETAAYLQSLEAERKANVKRIRMVQEELRFRDFNSLNIRYKLAGMIAPSLLGETEIPAKWLFFGRIYGTLVSVFALLHVVAAVMATVKEGNAARDIGEFGFYITTGVAVLDLIFRVITIAPRTSIFGLVFDLIVVIASIFHIGGVLEKYAIYFALLRSVRAFRAILLYEAFETCRDMFLVQKAIQASMSPLMVVLAIFIIGLVVFSTAVWVLEQSSFDTAQQLRRQTCASNDLTCSERLSPFQSIPNAMWLIVSAMSTVGLGDVIPNNTLSRIVVGIAMVFGVFMIAFPAMILVGNLQLVRASYFAMLERRTAKLQVLAVMYLAKKEQIDTFNQQKRLLVAEGKRAGGFEEEVEGQEGGGKSEGMSAEEFIGSGSPILMLQSGSPTNAPSSSAFGSRHNSVNNASAPGGSSNAPTLAPPATTTTSLVGENPFSRSNGGGNSNGTASIGLLSPPPPPYPNNSSTSSSTNRPSSARGGSAVTFNPLTKPSGRTVVGFADESGSNHNANNNNGEEDSNKTLHSHRNSATARPVPAAAAGVGWAAGGDSAILSNNASLRSSRDVTPRPLSSDDPQEDGGGGGGGGAFGSRLTSPLGGLKRRSPSNLSATGGPTTNRNFSPDRLHSPFQSKRSFTRGGGGGGGDANSKNDDGANEGGHRKSLKKRTASSSQLLIGGGGNGNGNGGGGNGGALQRVPSNLRRTQSSLQQAVMDHLKEDATKQRGSRGGSSDGGDDEGVFSPTRSNNNDAVLSITNVLGAGGGGGLMRGSSFGGSSSSLFGGVAATELALKQKHFDDPLQPEPMDGGNGIMYCGEALLVESQRDGLKALRRVAVPGTGFGLQPGPVTMPFLPTKAKGSAAIGNPGVTLTEEMTLFYSPICKLLTDNSISAFASANNGPLVSNIVLLSDDTALFTVTLLIDDTYARTVASEIILSEVMKGTQMNEDVNFGDVLVRALPMKGLEVTVVSGLPSNMVLLRRSDTAEVEGTQLPLVFLVKNVSKYGVPTPEEMEKQTEAYENGRLDLATMTNLNNSGRADCNGTNGNRLLRYPLVDPAAIALAIGKEMSHLQLRLLFRHAEKASCSWRQTSHVNRSLLSHADILRELRAIAVNVSPSLYWPAEVQKVVAKAVRERRQNVAFVKKDHIGMFVDRVLAYLVSAQIKEHAKQLAGGDDADGNGGKKDSAAAAAGDGSTIIITNRSEIQSKIADLFAYHCREVYKFEVPKAIHSAIFAAELVESTDLLLEVNIDFFRHGVWPLGTIAVEYAFSTPPCERLSLINHHTAPGVVEPASPLKIKIGNRNVLQRVKTFVDEDIFEASVRHVTGEDENELFDNIYEQNKRHAQLLVAQLGLKEEIIKEEDEDEDKDEEEGGDDDEEKQQQQPQGDDGHANDQSGNGLAPQPTISFGIYPNSPLLAGGRKKRNNKKGKSEFNTSSDALVASPSAAAIFAEEDIVAAKHRRQEYHKKLTQSVNMAATGKIGVPGHLLDHGGIGENHGDANDINNLILASGGGDSAKSKGSAAVGSGMAAANGVGHIPPSALAMEKQSRMYVGFDSTMLSSTNNKSRNGGGGGSSSNADDEQRVNALWRLQQSLGFNTYGKEEGAATTPTTTSPTALYTSQQERTNADGMGSPAANAAAAADGTFGVPIASSPSLAISPTTALMDAGGNISNLMLLKQRAEAEAKEKEAQEKLEKAQQAQPKKRLVSYGTGSTPAAIAAAKAKKEKEDAEYFEKVLNKGKKAQEQFLERKRVLSEAQRRQAAERAMAAKQSKDPRQTKTKSGVTEWAEGFKRFFNSHMFSSKPHTLQIKDDPSSPRRTR